MLKMMRKLIILCVVGSGFLFFIEGEEVQATSTIVATDQKESDFSYKEEKDSLGVVSITITGYDDTKTDVTIPEEINGFPVTKIDDRAFAGTSTLTKIKLPNTITNIGLYAFSGSGLTSIEIPSSMTRIGRYAFSEATKLTKVKLPNTLKGIEPLAFEGSGLESITIPASMTRIDDFAFFNASALKSIELPDTLKNIGASVFSGSGLESITIPASMTIIGGYAFNNASKLTSIELPDTLKSIESHAFFESGLTSIKIPASMTYINSLAFYNAFELKNIELPNTLTSIGPSAFAGSGLESIEIPSSMTSIGRYAFSEASALKEIKLPNTLTSIGDSAFYRASTLKEIKLPNTLTSIGDSAFEGSGLESIEIPASMTSIGSAAFEGASALKEIKLPNTLTSIGYYAFSRSGLESIEIPASMTSIGYSAFEGASALKEIKLPNTLTSINDYAFNGASALKEIKLPNTLTSIGYSAFEGSGLTSIKSLASATKINIDAFPGLKGVTVYAYTGSTAETYATNRISSDNWRFVTLYDVTFNSNGGSAVLKEIVDTGKVATEPTEPTKANHRFESWYEDAALTKEFDFTKPVTQDLTLYAKWVYVPNVAPPAEILDLSNIGDSSTGIQGIVSPNSYIQIVLNGTELANGRADNEGRFNIEIPSLLAGTELKMIVTNRFGSKKTIFLKVVDKTAPKVTVKPFSDKDTKITGKTEPKAKVKIYINGKLVKTITADEKGNYSYTVPKKKAGTVIKVIATDQAGNATTKTFKVLDKTAPTKPTVKTLTTNSTTLTGKAEKGSTVYVYKNNRVIAKVKVDSNGKYSVKIPKQKLGTKLTLIARDQAKNTSKKTNTKVKKA